VAYVTPAFDGADFNLNLGPYTTPPAYASDFDLADFISEIVYQPIPGVIVTVGAIWRAAAKKGDRAFVAPFQTASRHHADVAINASQAGQKNDVDLGVSFARSDTRDRIVGAPWELGRPKENRFEAPFKRAGVRDIARMASLWQVAGVLLDEAFASPYLARTPVKDLLVTESWYSSELHARLWRRRENLPAALAISQQGIAHIDLVVRSDLRLRGHIELAPAFENNPIQPKDSAWHFRHNAGSTRDVRPRVPWGAGRPVDITRAVDYPVEPGPIDDGGMGPDENTFTIPTLRFYIVANSAQIVRVSDGRNIPANAVQLSISVDSYSWSMSATVAGRDAIALLEGTDAAPTEVDVIINDVSWRVLIDGWRVSQAWSRHSVTVRGRSRAAYLAAPYALPRDYVEGSTLLAQQLAEQELPEGWSLAWDIEDWTVDAGAWKYAGLAPIDAIARIAKAGGGYVYADRNDDTIHVKPLYSSAPWEWKEQPPDILLPRAVIVQRDSQHRPGIGVNAVYVHGAEPGGILAKVLRTGTAGNVLAQTIVDPLITDTIPARWRGIAAIAETRRQAEEVYELPLSESLAGLIEPGALVATGDEYSGDFFIAWRGMVRGVSVSARATRANNGGVALSVRQQITIERHFEDGEDGEVIVDGGGDE
jgi:hypothetical protein